MRFDLGEPALLEHADRRDVGVHDFGVQRTRIDDAHELGEGLRREPAAPELSPDPVATSMRPSAVQQPMLPATSPSQTIVHVSAESFASVLAQCAMNASRSREGNAAIADASGSRWCS